MCDKKTQAWQRPVTEALTSPLGHVSFLDADDILGPSFLEECSNALAGSAAGYAYATAQRFGADEVTWEAQPFNILALKRRNFIPVTVLMELAKLDDVRFDGANAIGAWEDWEFFVRLATPRSVWRSRAAGDLTTASTPAVTVGSTGLIGTRSRNREPSVTSSARTEACSRSGSAHPTRNGSFGFAFIATLNDDTPKRRCRPDPRTVRVSSLGQRQFRIVSFVNRPELYVAMRESFEAAGFVEPLAHYTVETGDPYTAITRLGQADEPYVILVHQDVFCDQGFTAGDLLARLEELTKLDDRWAIAGNSGGDSDHQLWLHLNHPDCQFRSTQLPHQVVTLDENMLILRTAETSPLLLRVVRFSPVRGRCLPARGSGRIHLLRDRLPRHSPQQRK